MQMDIGQMFYVTTELWPKTFAGTSAENQPQPLQPLAKNTQELFSDYQLPHFFPSAFDSGGSRESQIIS